MKRLWLWATLAICPIASNASAPQLTAENVATFFDAAFAAQIQDHEIVGAVVSVVKDDATLFQRGYGLANLEERTPASAEQSLFRIASISKPFVWTAIMQLEEQGKLSLDDDVNQYLTSFKIPETFEQPIRIRHLLSHTPGLEDRGIGMGARTLESKMSLEDYLKNHMPARVRPPGVQASYSNWGTSLAGYIVEQISGQTWSDYIDQHILAPLVMQSTNTQTQMSDALQQRHAASYVWSGGKFTARPFTYLNDEPAGAMSTTAADMARFMRAHLNFGTLEGQRILSEATARRMREPLFDPHPGISPMLHGFYRSDRNGQTIFGHGGDTNQFHSNMSLYPDHNLGVFVAFNSDPAAAARSNLVRAFTDHFFPQTYLPKAPEPATQDLAEYSGDYLRLRANSSRFERLANLIQGVRITAGKGALTFNGQSRWVPLGEDRFTGLYTNSLMVFERTDGTVDHVMINSPLSTFRRVTGLEAPSNQRVVLGFAFLIAVITVLGYGYRTFVRRADQPLPRRSTITAWAHAFLTVSLLSYLGYTLSGNVEDMVYGVPTAVHVNLLLMALNVLIGIVVIAFAIHHWVAGDGTVGQRLRYSLIGLAALANLWFALHFNIVTYPFS